MEDEMDKASRLFINTLVSMIASYTNDVEFARAEQFAAEVAKEFPDDAKAIIQELSGYLYNGLLTGNWL
jgi:hypothetical protein